MKLPWIIVIVLAIALALLWIFRPEPQDEKIERLEHENDSLLIRLSQHEANGVKLAERRKADSLASIETATAYKSEAEKKDRLIAYYRANPKVIEIIKEVPEIDSAFKAYDSALAHKDERIRELESELTTSQQLASQAEQNFNATVADYKNLHANMLEQVEHYKKELRKQRRKTRLATVLIPVVGVAGFVLGSQL